MKKLFLSIVALCAITLVSAQDVVTLTVNGQGVTKEVATANALRSAIEQAFGVFVSANTQILNDNLVKDEIATVSSGNIQAYKELSCVNMPNGEVSATLSATVAIGKLVAYAKSKGSSAEFAGQTFAMDMKMKELNKQNEIKALEHAQQQLRALAEHMFDWKLSVGDPIVARDGNYDLEMTITAASNEASDAFYKTFFGILNSLALSPTQKAEYNNARIPTYSVRIQSYDEERGFDPWGNSNSFKKVFTFRSDYIFNFIEDVHYILRTATNGFTIRETNDVNKTYSRRFDKNASVTDSREGGELSSLLRKYITIYNTRGGGFHTSSPSTDYVTYDRSLDVYGLSKYTIRVVKKKKLPEPIIYTNDIFRQTMKIRIEKDRIGSVAGFEVIRSQTIE